MLPSILQLFLLSTALGLIISCPSEAKPQGKKDRENVQRQKDPQIISIRELYQAIVAGAGRRSWKTKTREKDCEGSYEVIRRLTRDDKGRIRRYIVEGGSEDSAYKIERYYDESGHLRFVLITGGSVNGTNMEHRIYFGKTGKRLFEKEQLIKGPGYPFYTWSDKELLNDAETMYEGKFCAS